jgi:hypothetical protein
VQAFMIAEVIHGRLDIVFPRCPLPWTRIQSIVFCVG